MTTAPESSMNFLSSNRRWLLEASPKLAELLDAKTIAACELQKRQVDDELDLLFDGERVLESCQQSLQDVLMQQLKRTDGVAMPRPVRPNKPGSSVPSTILSEMVDVHYEVLLNHLPALPVDSNSLVVQRPPYRNLLVFGSLMLVPLLKRLREVEVSPWISITLVEDDPRQLAATMSLIDVSCFVDLCKKMSVGLILHVDTGKAALQDRLYAQVGKNNPTLLYGWQTLRSPVLSPALMELHSWLHAPEGAAQHVIGLLGFATDDINQTQQALWNALSQRPMQVLAQDCLASDNPVVLVASGPSLMDQLPWLREHGPKLNLVAAGSALGTLLREGIRPSAVVFLERSAETYSDLCDLLADGFSLEGIALLASSTVDPRLPILFDQVIFFHRPASMATGLFPDDQGAVLPVCGPHVINATLEAVLALGSRELLLVGADFAAVSRTQPRAHGALGVSPRDFSIPVQGNKGKTVFSEPGLLYTGYLLDRVLQAVPNCRVRRLGEGAVLSAAQTVEQSIDLARQFTRAPGALQEALSDLPLSSFDREDCEMLFNLLEQDIAAIMESLRSVIEPADGWSKSLVASLVPFLQRLHEGDTRQRRMLSQLLCHPLFFVSMSLYDAPSNSLEEFGVAKSNALSSLEILRGVVQHWLEVMRPWLSAPQLPLWDPAWVRSRYCRLEGSKA